MLAESRVLKMGLGTFLELRFWRKWSKFIIKLILGLKIFCLCKKIRFDKILEFPKIQKYEVDKIDS